jgi:hypothetical protein
MDFYMIFFYNNALTCHKFVRQVSEKGNQLMARRELTIVTKDLKLDVLGQWIETEWLPHHSDQDLLTLFIPDSCIDDQVIERFNPEFELAGEFLFFGYKKIECPVITRAHNYDHAGHLHERSGAFLYQFTETTTGRITQILVMSAHYGNHGNDLVCLATVPQMFVPIWTAFTNECNRIARSLQPTQKVVVIGGRSPSFVPTISWDEVILPSQLKNDLMDDVVSFFVKGVAVYKRLNLKPFRKLLLAGIPGTGKTMLCTALAKWAIEQGYLVVYISSADRSGATFGKIEHAVAVASHSNFPTLIILEELDAYLHNKEEKAVVLNVLDGAESLVNDKGTLLIATTNYPEAIDERILKRPGRLDRIFIIPEIREHDDAEKMLRKYLGSMWRDEHSVLVPSLIGYPGAFIREVAVYALTQVAYIDGTELSLEMLEDSFKRLKQQIDVRDNFLKHRPITLLRRNGHPSRN